jgi:tellurium resistance protein TerZ
MINLSKGGRINLSKDENGKTFDKLFFGANWGMITRKTLGMITHKDKVDLDSSLVMLDAEGKHVKTVYFGNLSAPGVIHSGDDRSGDSNGDDGIDNETIEVTLSKLDPRVEHAFFVINNYTHQKFDEIPYIGLRIYESSNGEPKKKVTDPVNILAEYKLKKEDSKPIGKESVILGEAYRRNGEWKFKAIGEFGNISKVSDFPAECKKLI